MWASEQQRQPKKQKRVSVQGTAVCGSGGGSDQTVQLVFCKRGAARQRAWALRRASVPLKKRRVCVEVCVRVCVSVQAAKYSATQNRVVLLPPSPLSSLWEAKGTACFCFFFPFCLPQSTFEVTPAPRAPRPAPPLSYPAHLPTPLRYARFVLTAHRSFALSPCSHPLPPRAHSPSLPSTAVHGALTSINGVPLERLGPFFTLALTFGKEGGDQPAASSQGPTHT